MSRDKKSKLPPDASTKEYQHYNAVLLEEIRSQMNGVIETVQLTGQRLDEKIDGVEKRLTERLEIVEMVVRGNSEDIKKNSEDIKKNSEDIKKNTVTIQRLEQKLDPVIEKVERHDVDILRLKSAVLPA
ncbi:MAG: hypothetical protein A2W61_04810 [Deltaproteobacteria bacterium RIFCSPLOWO2_01_44_7]|nr:MAG: hypothetical protein A2712_07365 [Deltaproteobacteria bacterium RIFCSPHIGHO2_01_FULL_43_49]OGQ15763.1 MAG: hypothetical protein A3D22_06155 [Deltaproteobacteria bacterium RIFCSPHIGHO2_02_FULL_44_53]OGQ29432.1 MAG: hypothetical protein A3D98_11100 [Deltaproteobacteria bacterium RIFCSPHIGHO2_12_FULL_44_21]OGQ32056.1 MAG: hypothetical protein A2979_03100 [Deltaproteobacteria bacterium RIFCSPLOWO2_01_FULL_45_74]OGQ40773.1 MAG: hypothetical protein A2W61_04810 [Deltaproteobacteria bacterium 